VEERGFGEKRDDDGGGGADSPDGGAVQTDCQCIYCTIKSRKRRAIMEEADEKCSTAGLLIHSRLKVKR